MKRKIDRYWTLRWAVWIQSAPLHAEIHFSIILSAQGLPGGLFPSCFLTRILYVFLISQMRTTCHAILILLHLFALTIFDEEYSWRLILHILPSYPVFCVSLLSSALCFHTSSVCVPPLIRDVEFHTHTKQVRVQFQIAYYINQNVTRVESKREGWWFT
jgi:hypothetical protein